MTPREARRMVSRLHTQLGTIVGKDQEQEVGGIALPVLDAVLAAAREHLLLDDPVLAVLPDLISPETLAEGRPIRAIEAYLVASQIEEGLTRAIDAGGDPDLFAG